MSDDVATQDFDRPIASRTTRPATQAAHHSAVEDVLAIMRTHVSEPLNLRLMAEIAALSPSHFIRVFQAVTGIPPQQFLILLRMEAAKRLLLTTGMRVIDISSTVGYASVSSFTSRFTRLVGFPPQRFRALTSADIFASKAVRAIMATGARPRQDCSPHAKQLSGSVHTTSRDVLSGPIFLGLFPHLVPTGQPVACTFLLEPGSFCIPTVAMGHLRILAVSHPWSFDIVDYLLPNSSALRVGASEPVLVRDARSENLSITLRPMRSIDPPLVGAFQFTPSVSS